MNTLVDPQIAAIEDQDEPEVTCLYRHFDAHGTLLYVGISLSAIARTMQHRDCSHWYYDIRNITIEHFPSRQEAYEAETIAIQTERPKFNIAKVTDPEYRNIHALVSKRNLLQQVVSFKPLYKVAEAADLLKIGTGTLKGLVETRDLNCIYIKGRMFFTGWQLLDYLEALQARTKGWK